MDFNKYNLSLRFRILPDKYAVHHTDKVIAEALKSGYTDICLVVDNGHGHPTKEQLAPQVETYKRAAGKIRAAGLSVSLNPYITMGQNKSDLFNGRKFTSLTAANGATQSAACPLDEDFIDYIKDIYRYLCGEIKPDVVWLEDDFRMHNRLGEGWGGCFCELHLKEYSKYLGFDVTREEFLAGLLKENVGRSAYREAYAFVTRKAMERLAAAIGEGAREGYPSVRVGFMTSHSEEHAIEYRDWHRLFAAADDKNAPIDRMHLPCYDECSPQVYGWLFNKICMQTRARIPENTIVLPELETAPRSVFSKSAEFARMTVETTAPVVPGGVTMFIYNAGGVIKEWGYGPAMKSIIPFMQAIKNENLSFSSLDGVIVPFSKETVLNQKPTNYFYYLDHLKPDDSFFSAYLSVLGITYKLVEDPIFFRNKVVAVSGQWLRNFDNDAIAAFLGNNRVILNAEAILTLCDMGLNSLIGVKSAKWAASDSENGATREYVDPWFTVYGVKGFNDWTIPHLEIEYEKSDDFVSYTHFYSFFGKKLHLGSVRRGNILFFPFKGEFFEPAKLFPIREAVVKDFVSGGLTSDGKLSKGVKKASGDNPSFIINAAMCCPYFYAESNILLVNNFSHDRQKAAFYLPTGYDFSSIKVLSRGGVWSDVKFTNKCGYVSIIGKYFEPLKTTAIKFV